MAFDQAGLEQTIETYQQLRKRCYRAARAENGKLMGDDAWLRNALQESELELSVTGAGVDCYGSTFTTQTMQVESFSFTIPFDALEQQDA